MRFLAPGPGPGPSCAPELRVAAHPLPPSPRPPSTQRFDTPQKHEAVDGFFSINERGGAWLARPHASVSPFALPCAPLSRASPHHATTPCAAAAVCSGPAAGAPLALPPSGCASAHQAVALDARPPPTPRKPLIASTRASLLRPVRRVVRVAPHRPACRGTLPSPLPTDVRAPRPGQIRLRFGRALVHTAPVHPTELLVKRQRAATLT